MIQFVVSQMPVTMPEKMPESMPQLIIWIVCALLMVMVWQLYASLSSRDKSNTEDRSLLKELVQDARTQVAETRKAQSESQDKFLTALDGVRTDHREAAHKSRELFALTVDKVLSDGEKKLEKVCTTFAQGFKDLSDKVEKHGCRSG